MPYADGASGIFVNSQSPSIAESSSKACGNRRATIFVLSDTRSGSTLLDQCLGANPDIASLGEVHWLRAYATQDRKLYNPEHELVCSCGRQVVVCPFWCGVEATIGRPLAGLELRSERLRRLLTRMPGSFRMRLVRRLAGLEAVALDSTALYDAVSIVTGRRHCIDSSKSVPRFRAVFDLEPNRTFAIVLVRDYRSVVHSKMRRGVSLESAAGRWRRKMEQIEMLTKDVPATKVSVLKYETLCEAPQSELSRLCAFIGVPFTESMVRRPSGDIHHIGGSPSKFDPSRAEIVRDRLGDDAFQPEQLARLRQIVGPFAAKWGY